MATLVLAGCTVDGPPLQSVEVDCTQATWTPVATLAYPDGANGVDAIVTDGSGSVLYHSADGGITSMTAGEVTVFHYTTAPKYNPIILGAYAPGTPFDHHQIYTGNCSDLPLYAAVQATPGQTPTVSTPPTFDIRFGEEVSDFTASDLVVGGTAGAAGVTITPNTHMADEYFGGIANMSESDIGVFKINVGYRVSFASIARAGTVTLSLPRGSAHGASGDANDDTDTVSIDVAAIAPAAPTALTAARSNRQLDLSWTAPEDTGGAGISNYVVQQQSADGSWSTVTTSTSTSTSASVNGLTNGVQYSFRVAAENQAGVGAFSTPVSAIPATVPGPPSDLAAVPGDRDVSLSWLAPTDNGGATDMSYIVQQQDADASWRTVLTSATTSALLTNLTNGTPTRFRVLAQTKAGVGDASRDVLTTPFDFVPSIRAAGRTLGSGARVRAGDQVSLSADGLPAGAIVTLTLHSQAALLAKGSVNASGSVAIAGHIPTSATPGRHQLVATLTLPDGITQSSSTLSVTMLAAEPDFATYLAHTGISIVMPVVLAIGLLIAGIVLLIARRRRQRGETLSSASSAINPFD